MSIVINPAVPQVAAQVAVQGATATVVLQPGTVVAAKVLQILGNDTVQIAIGGQSIAVQSQVPLQAGQTLQLAVSQGSDGTVRLAVVNPQGGAAASPTTAGPANATAVSDSVTLAPGIATPAISAVVVANNQLTPLESLAISVAAQIAATQQTSLAPLFANLGVAAGLTGLPPQLQQAVAQVLAQRTSLDPTLSGDDIKQAFQSSGLFLEASLAAGSVSASGGTPDLKAALIVLRQVLTTSLNGATAAQTTQPAATQAAATPTTAALQQATTPGAVVPGQGTQPSVQLPSQVTSQAVPLTVGPETPITASPALAPLLASELVAPEMLLQGAASPTPQAVLDLGVASIISPASTPADAAARSVASSAALNLLQEVVQAGPLAAGNPSRLVLDDGLTLSLLPAVAGARILGVDDGEFARTNVPPPPISGALPAAQPVMAATLVSNSPLETAMHHLLADTDGAIARQTLLQVASLPGQADTTAARLDPTAPRWNFEIPFMTPQGTAMAQFEISRDGGGNEIEAAKRVWRARFSLDLEPAGPVHAQVSLSGDRTSVRMWAERPATADQLRAGASQLSQALSRAELQPGDIVIRDGAPVQSASAPAGHFLDRAL
jgi:Flagellar hook-length control protein FliK